MQTHYKQLSLLANSLLAILFASSLMSGTTPAQSAPNAAAADQPLKALPYTPSLDPKAMDRSVNPCDDLYTYSCGGWQKANPIPADQSSWSVYGKVQMDNQRFLWGVLEEAAKVTPQRTPTQQKIGDFFAACMDEAAIEKRGIAPLQPDLTRIAALKSTNELPALLGDLHSRTSTRGLLFVSGVEQDARDATKMIAAIGAGGLGLPDRDYYFKDDAKSKEIRSRYSQHIAKLLEIAGDKPQDAAKSATTILAIETKLAGARLTRVEMRDPYNVYHRNTPAELKKLVPAFDWPRYFSATGLQPGEWLNVAEPKFFTTVDAFVKSESLDNLKVYLRWALINSQAPYLSKAFVDENFAFNSAYLNGVEQQPPRWKKCVRLVDRNLGEALGQEFVARTFPATVKAQTVLMTEQIEKAMRARINQLTWMSEATKKQAIAKLEKMRNKVGYPDLWRDYSALTVTRGDFYNDLSQAIRFESNRQAAKIGKPVDRGEWDMTPATVNAYYNPQMNDINFPAAVLLPPLFDPKMDAAPNYGNTGGTIGHELTHGFDDEGRQFDGNGNLNDWWQKPDAVAFEKGAQCVRDQYAKYTIVDDIKINSKLTAGEDIADLGGLILAWVAWQEQTRNSKLTAVDGLTPEQRFFVGFAQWDCANHRPETLRAQAIVNPHSPSKHRINGVVVNMPEFARAFNCKVGSALVKKPEDICRIW